MIGYCRRNFLVPAPRSESFEVLNIRLEEQCLERQSHVLRGHSVSIGEQMRRDLDALMGKKGKREYVQVLRLLERFEMVHVQAQSNRRSSLGLSAMMR